MPPEDVVEEEDQLEEEVEDMEEEDEKENFIVDEEEVDENGLPVRYLILCFEYSYIINFIKDDLFYNLRYVYFY